MAIVFVGIDLAKNVFAVHGVNPAGKSERAGYWKAVVAIAAKNARMAWAVLVKGEAFAMPA